jgi:hypothetical protein
VRAHPHCINCTIPDTHASPFGRLRENRRRKERKKVQGDFVPQKGREEGYDLAHSYPKAKSNINRKGNLQEKRLEQRDSSQPTTVQYTHTPLLSGQEGCLNPCHLSHRPRRNSIHHPISPGKPPPPLPGPPICLAGWPTQVPL